MQNNLRDEHMDRLFQAILGLENLEQCYALFSDLCTVNELLAMKQRFWVARLLKEGYKADLVVIDITGPHMYPVHDLINNLVYSASGSDVVMTMADGKVLYENGEYKTIDIEKTLFEADRWTKKILKQL